ncbi:MAG: hypothetical protein CSA42_03575 [Gammaproteobacteria bacterium]|nr:MAG: hypothetical protein CSA42_03575 [Gammaproteobacteria bacterium]
MTTFNFKNPPKGWVYPLTKKSLRNFIHSINSTITNIDYAGTRQLSKHYLPNVHSCWIGNLKAEKLNNKWYFSIEIYALKEEFVTPWQEQIQDVIFMQIKQWINKKEALPATSPEKPTELFLNYEIKDGKITPTCWEVE